jgi:hypothetical protein
LSRLTSAATAFRISYGQRVAPARRTKLGDDGNQMQADGNYFPVFILGWMIGAIGVECDGMISLSDHVWSLEEIFELLK